MSTTALATLTRTLAQKLDMGDGAELIDTLKAIAAAYLSAFTQNAKTYPYLVG